MSSQTSPQRDRYVRAGEFQVQSVSQFGTSQNSPGRGPQEYQAFPIQFEQQVQPLQGRETGAGAGARKSGGWPQPQLETFPPSTAHQRLQQQQIPVEHLPYGLQNPASPASLSYYDSSPERPRVASSSVQLYLSSSRARYASGSQGDDGKYSTADSDSVYAYSEGANVVPSRYGQPPTREQQPREAAPTYLRQIAADYRNSRAEGSGEARMKKERRL
ncbi:hypothetical protein BDV93DRAFT_328935 [Ceratobasidium sp. AG-I]|nr:hypothetical protein BDV93DRAFT_328935 [Ceratobasidium sp. AG-I]